MTEAELKTLTLAKAVQLLGQNAISSDELIGRVLQRISRLDSAVRAFITVITPLENQMYRAPLFGAPISVKDLYDTKGIRTTAGSKLFADRIPQDDAITVQLLKEAGAAIIGKTNLHEFAFGLTTVNPHFGIARNPWNSERVAGGSSGGSAVAVALGMGFGSLGTDTGGSIRIPAALCGIVGLKPTSGLVSTRGIVPLSWSLDHAGPMTRTVEDTAMLLEIIAAADARRFTAALDGNIAGVRVGIPNNYFFEDIAPEVNSAVREAIHRLEELGAELVDIEVPDIAIHRAVWLQIATPEAYSFHERRLREHPDAFGPDVRVRLEPGRELLSIDYVRAQRARTVMQEHCEQLFERVDVFVTPTVPIPAPLIEDKAVVPSLARFTRYFNVAGLPTISIPCGFTPDGLPIGMQIAARAFGESTVLRVAHAYEQSAKWFERIPEN